MEESKTQNIGIVGWWNGVNYGSTLTTFSLYKFLEANGFKVSMVRAATKTPAESHDDGISDFAKKHYSYTTQCRGEQMKDLNNSFDTFIVASDQLWNYPVFIANGYFFMLNFSDDSKKKISYSTSFGHQTSRFPDNAVPKAKELLGKFDFLSVRESSGIDILRDIFGCKAVQVPDPVFLCDTKYYKDVASDSAIKHNKPYIFTYILDPTDAKKEIINYVAEKFDISIVAMTDPQREYEKRIAQLSDYDVVRGGVPEWLWHIINCDFVVADSFHGICFSLIFGKPFIAINNNRRGADRFVSLLSQLNMNEYLVESVEQVRDNERLFEAQDYKRIADFIKNERKRGSEWLLAAIKAPKDVRVQNIVISDTLKATKPISGFQVNAAKINLRYGTKSFKSKMFEPFDICVKYKCTGCSACANICHVNAITMKEDHEGFIYPQIDHVKCTHCNMCNRICPALHHPVKPQVPPLAVYAGFSENPDVRYMSTSGGAFTEFAQYILQMSGVCYGASYGEDLSVCHIRIDNENDIHKIRQSKYYQSNIGNTFRLLKKDLESGRYVAFCGTPCQCAGLFNYLRKDYDKLLIIDFICHSICSPKAFRAYLKDIEQRCGYKAKSVWFKNKETTWKNFSIRIDFDGTDRYYRQLQSKDAFFQSFLKYRACLRPSCHDCRFKGYHRAADVTLADFWGLKWNNPDFGETEMKDGVSLIILNSEKGVYMFDNFVTGNMYTEQHILEEALKANGAYWNSHKVGLYRDALFANLDTVPFCELIKSFDEREAVTAEQNAKKG